MANGRLAETRDNADGTRTFHWIQKGPIPNYLVTVDVAEFAKVPLQRREGRGEVDSARGVDAARYRGCRAAFVFGNTPDMVEYFSCRRWATRIPGTSTTRSSSGSSRVRWRRRRRRVFGVGAPPRGRSARLLAPEFESARPVFTYEDVVAHELAHHWFGDLLTCRSLGSLWVNESFATLLAHDVEREGARRGRHDLSALDDT